MLWPIFVRMGFPLDLAKLIDYFASTVQAVSCAVPNCPRVAVSANHRCRRHSRSAVNIYFLFPCKNPFVCEGLMCAMSALADRRYFARMEIRAMDEFLMSDHDERVVEAKKDRSAECESIDEAIKLLGEWK